MYKISVSDSVTDAADSVSDSVSDRSSDSVSDSRSVHRLRRCWRDLGVLSHLQVVLR